MSNLFAQTLNLTTCQILATRADPRTGPPSVAARRFVFASHILRAALRPPLYPEDLAARGIILNSLTISS